MKKLSAILSFTIMCSTILTFSPLASADDQGTPYGIVPTSAQIIMAVHPDNMGDTLKQLYGSLINPTSMIAPYLSYLPEDASQNLLNIDTYLVSLLNTQSLYLTGVKLTEGYYEYSDVGAGIFVKLSQQDFDTNIKAPLETEKIITQTAYAKNPIYKISMGENSINYFSTIYYTVYQGYLIACQEEGTLQYIIDNTSPISSNSNFSKTKANFLSNSSLDVYVDFNALIQEYGLENSPELENQLAILKAFQNMGVSISETGKTFKGKFYISQDAAKIKELGFDYSNIKPVSIYKYFPSLNPIIFTDSAATKDSFTMLKNDPSYQEFVNGFNSTLGTDFEKDVLPAIQKETGFLIQNTGDLLPAMTILTDISANPDPMKTLISNLSTNLWTALTQKAERVISDKEIRFVTEKGTFFITKKPVTIGKSTLDQYKIEFEQKQSSNPYAFKLPKEILGVTLTMGTTDDKILLISTNKTISKDYKQGIQSNADIKTMVNESPNGMSYFSTKNFGNYITDALSIIKDHTQANINDFEEFKTLISEITDIIGNLSVTSNVANDYTSATITMTLDINSFGSLSDKFSELYAFDLFDKIDSSDKEFKDISIDKWYADDVYFLSTEGVINGYEDGSFKPGQEVTKAEFLKLVIETLKSKGVIGEMCTAVSCSYIQDDQTADSYIYNTFTDVNSTSWSAPYIYTAYNLGFLDTVTNKKIEPNKVLTRGEAVHILAKVAAKYLNSDTVTNKEFTDVKAGTTLAGDVSLIGGLGIMTGTTETKFSPNGKLNRAETAKIIRIGMKVIEEQLGKVLD